nr:uncharacterized protein LOC128690684 [Cherax quadricarinatus]
MNISFFKISYISTRNRGEYVSRPKSIPGAKPPKPTPVPAASTAIQSAWDEDSIKDTRSRPHRSRSLTREEATRRDSSTESNNISSPVQQRQHYQHQKSPSEQYHQHHMQQQQLTQQQQQTGNEGPHLLPPATMPGSLW